ncbi:hypothetical protein U1Q18_029387 [Sarracenia purpurea var. burkii]
MRRCAIPVLELAVVLEGLMVLVSVWLGLLGWARNHVFAVCVAGSAVLAAVGFAWMGLMLLLLDACVAAASCIPVHCNRFAVKRVCFHWHRLLLSRLRCSAEKGTFPFIASLEDLSVVAKHLGCIDVSSMPGTGTQCGSRHVRSSCCAAACAFCASVLPLWAAAIVYPWLRFLETLCGMRYSTRVLLGLLTVIYQ